MTETYQDILYREVIETINGLKRDNARLHEQLRGSNTIVVELKNEVVRLNHDFRKLDSAFSVELKCSLKHHGELCQMIGEIYDRLGPLMKKVFPNRGADDLQRINDILGRS